MLGVSKRKHGMLEFSKKNLGCPFYFLHFRRPCPLTTKILRWRLPFQNMFVCRDRLGTSENIVGTVGTSSLEVV